MTSIFMHPTFDICQDLAIKLHNPEKISKSLQALQSTYYYSQPWSEFSLSTSFSNKQSFSRGVVHGKL